MTFTLLYWFQGGIVFIYIFQMKVPVSMHQFVNLTAGKVIYIGPQSLVQFTVENTSMILHSPKYLTVEITFKRTFLYHLAATFAPTILLMIVTQITLFVDHEKHFDATIMVHLTTMLVMYTLYQGVADSMPKTAYLKSIDIWLLYGLTLPFFTFVVEVSAKLLNRHQIRKTQPHAPALENQTEVVSFDGHDAASPDIVLEPVKAGACLMAIAQTILPLMTVLFVAIYALLCISSYGISN